MAVHLQNRSGHHGIDGAFDHAAHRVRFAKAGGHEHDVLRLHDGRDAHRQGMSRHHRILIKEAAVVMQRLLRELDAIAVGRKMRRRFVKADVTVRAESEQLQIDLSRCGNRRVVIVAFLVLILRQAVGNMDVIRREIDLRKEVFLMNRR